MRFASAALLLPSLALAAGQIPLVDKVKGWFQQAQSSIPTKVPSIPNPVQSGAQKVADGVVHHLTLEDWRTTVESSSDTKPGPPKEWFVYVTGGNKTCYGLCYRVDAAWKEAAPIIALRPTGPKLAQVDCENNQVLCNSWQVQPPYLYVFEIPNTLPGQSRPETTVYGLPLNRSSTTARDFDTYATKKTYKEAGPYTGYLHPFDGIAIKSGLAIPIAYIIFYLSKLPSWAPMVIVSLATRTFMARRVNAQQPRQAQGQPGQGPVPPAAAPAAGARG